MYLILFVADVNVYNTVNGKGHGYRGPLLATLHFWHFGNTTIYETNNIINCR